MTATSPSLLKLLDTRAYLADLTRSVTQARTRVDLISLIFTEDQHTGELVEALMQAARRGVTVTIAADIFTFGELGGHLSPFQRRTPRSRKVLALAARFKAAGATYSWLGTSHKINPFGGITHLKWAVVDDTVYCFGGVNLYEHGIESIDYMFTTRDPRLAEQISHQHHVIIKTNTSRPHYPGYLSECDYGTIYIDSGRPHDSMIYNRLIELAEQAEHVLVVTQYCPSGPLARRLRGKSDVYYNPPARMPYPTKLLIKYGELRTGLRSQYIRPDYLHAKFMVFTLPGGKKIAITGSHNFSHSGVMFGTREVALETSDPHIITQLEQFHLKHVA